MYVRKCVLGYYEPYYTEVVKNTKELLYNLLRTIMRLSSIQSYSFEFLLSNYVEKTEAEKLKDFIEYTIIFAEKTRENSVEIMKAIGFIKSSEHIKNIVRPYGANTETVLHEFKRLNYFIGRTMDTLEKMRYKIKYGRLSKEDKNFLIGMINELGERIRNLTSIETSTLLYARMLFIEKDFCTKP